MTETRPPMRTVTGIAHVHTYYSYDGYYTPDQLAHIARARGWDFVLVSEHSNHLSRAAFEELVRTCRALSNDSFLMFPSIEYTCDHMLHILGYGAGYIDDFPTAPAELAGAIKKRGGLAILSHPRKYAGSPGLITSELLDAVDGIEVWNSKLAYDGPWIAPLGNYDFVRPGKLAFCGQDAHFGKHFSSLVFRVRVASLTREELLASLRSGRYTMTNGVFELDPWPPAPSARTRFLRAADTACALALRQARFVRNLIKGTGKLRPRPAIPEIQEREQKEQRQ
ncbi:MAG: hypothetical protein MJE77_05435 [Proteobacteria bacterium]|nr:hypothetical protein [Pseudomonadota bacterium]